MQAEQRPATATSGKEQLDDAQEAGLAPRLLREVLQTPAFRELVVLNTAEVEGATGRRLVKTLIDEGVELPLSAVGTIPGTLGVAASSATAVAEHLRGLPQPLLDAYVSSVADAIDLEELEKLPAVWGPLFAKLLPSLMSTLLRSAERLAETARTDDAHVKALAEALKQLDGAHLGRALNELSKLVLFVRTVKPDLLTSETAAAVIDDLIVETDFGKLRKAAAALSNYGREGSTAFIEQALSNPVALSNLVVALPSIIDDQVAIIEALIAGLNRHLPDELLASAITAVLEDVNFSALGLVLSDTAKLLNTLHRGSLILGGTEPAFKALFAEIFDSFLSSLDRDAIQAALVAVGEDGEIVAQVFSDVLRREPSLLPRFVESGLATTTPLVRGLVDLIREANQLPDETFTELSRKVAEGFDTDEYRTLSNEVVTFLLRCDRAGASAPLMELVGAMLEEESLRQGAARTVQAFGQLFERPALKEKVEPEAIGRWLNSLLIQFNHTMNGSDSASTKGRPNAIVRLMSAIDPQELEQAWQSLLTAIFGTTAGNGRLTRAILRPLANVGIQAALMVPRAAKRRLPKLPLASLSARNGGRA
jgi:hypothetical protein